MPQTSNTIQGYALLDVEGLIRWDTFTTIRQTAPDWVVTYKVLCSCENDVWCGKWLFDYTYMKYFYSESVQYAGTGTPTIDFEYGTIPTKFIVKKNGVQLLDTGYGGLSSYQSGLNTFLTTQGLPPETINPSPPSSYSVSVVSGDVVEVSVICIEPTKSSYRFRIGCVGAAINCEVSDWSAWSAWVDNGNGTQTRTRTRTIVTHPANGGTLCPPLTESETVPIGGYQECEVSDWVAGEWENDPDDNTQICRDLTRTIIVPPSGGAPPCPDLTDRECVPGQFMAFDVNFTNETPDPIDADGIFIGNDYSNIASTFPSNTFPAGFVTTYNGELSLPQVQITFNLVGVAPFTHQIVIVDSLSNTLYTEVTNNVDETFTLASGVTDLTIYLRLA